MASSVPLPVNDRAVRHHGRRFSHYGLAHNVYAVPIDHAEQQRMAELDDLIREAVGGQSLYVQLPRPVRGRAEGAGEGTDDDLPTVLDCGFGSGRWIDMLLRETDFDVDVTGVDICLSQSLSDDEEDDESDAESDGSDSGVGDFEKKRWNLNLPFDRDRSEDRLRPETFDVVNSRFLADGINAARWPGYIADIRKLLKRGGWVQMVELLPHVQSDNGSLSDDSNLGTWWTLYSRVLTNVLGKNVRVGRELERMLRREGFDSVFLRVYDLPIGRWKENEEQLGEDNRKIFKRMLEALTLWPFTRLAQMPLAQYQQLIAGARRELDNDSLKLYYKLYVVRGQRPRPRRR